MTNQQTTRNPKVTLERMENTKSKLWGLKFEWRDGSTTTTGGVPLSDLLKLIGNWIGENGDDIKK